MTVGRPSPSPQALLEARSLLRSLSWARQSFALYQIGHPKRSEAVQDVLESVRGLQELMPGGVALFVGRGGFYLGPTLLPRPSLTYHALRQAFELAGIHAVEFLPGADAADVESLMKALMAGDGQPLDPSTGSGIVLNRIGLVSDAPEGGMRELLRTYAAGLEFMRDTATRVAAGDPANMQAAGRLTERLADQVIADPSEALLLTTVKSYDEYTYYHMVNVGILCLALGQAIGLRREHVVALGMGGLLHDVGKIRFPR